MKRSIDASPNYLSYLSSTLEIFVIIFSSGRMGFGYRGETFESIQSCFYRYHIEPFKYSLVKLVCAVLYRLLFDDDLVEFEHAQGNICEL